jgi:acetyl-CoA carboxylase carboxyltransferase component
MKAVEDKITSDMDPYKAASQLDTDEIIAPQEIRSYLSTMVEATYQSIGYRRIKNPRIWSMHDIAIIADDTRQE